MSMPWLHLAGVRALLSYHFYTDFTVCNVVSHANIPSAILILLLGLNFHFKCEIVMKLIICQVSIFFSGECWWARYKNPILDRALT